MMTTVPRRRGIGGGTRARAAALGYAIAYDRIVEGYAPFEALADVIGTRLAGALPPEARVLDVACGTGTLARRLAGRGLRVTGIDAVPPLAAFAQRRRPERAASRLSFHLADVARGPIAGAPFDALVSLHTVTWHPDRHAFLAGCRTSLRPGAPAVFVAATRPTAVLPTMRRLAAREGAAAGARALRWLVPTALFERVRNADLHFPSAAELVDELTGAGFDVLECVPTFVADLSLLAWARRRAETSHHQESQSNERRAERP
jgi:2-polyprenyl-3-methyl-5-hydroxy-6-metoxy-1,4-benzoquinol methylase